MKNTKKLFLLVLLVCVLLPLQAQKFQGLAKTPPMGWNSWNKFGCEVNEKLIREIADAMVSSGMKESGYEYVVIDDCWHGERDSLDFITASSTLFPSGIKALADYIHSKGLKFGIYSSAGYLTCAGHPGGRGHEYQDAYMYSKWGVDYLKFDWCGADKLNAEGAYMTMSDAIYNAGRPMVFSLCEWGQSKPWEWGKTLGHMWRTTVDIFNCFDCSIGIGSLKTYGVMQILDLQDGLRKYAGPDHWNDPDMLEVGNGMSENEDRAHFTMWCMLAAPLISGNDLRNMTSTTLDILSNKEVIAIDQDALGIQGFRYAVKDSVETWLKPLQNGNWAVCLLNRSTLQKKYELNWKSFSVTDSLSKRILNTTTDTLFKIRNLWSKEDLGETNNNLKVNIPAHDVLCLKLFK